MSVEQEIRITNIPPGEGSLANLSRVQASVASSNLASLFGITLTEGEGAFIKDADDNIYLDCLAGAGVAVVGYGVNEIASAYYEAANQIQHTCTPYSLNTHLAELAETLGGLFPDDREDKAVLFGLSGSDGVGAALSVMRRVTEKFGVLYFKNAYHGSTGLSQQASGFETLKTGIYRQSQDFVPLDFPSSVDDSARVLEQIELHLKSGNIGGLLIEAIQGDGGINIPTAGFLHEARALLNRFNALLMVDEVQSGMGRTGRFWAIEHEQVVPDLIISAKGLAGGYAPISALIGNRALINHLDSAQQVFSFSAHGPCCAAASSTIEFIERKGLVQNAAQMGRYLIEGLRDVQQQYPDVIVDVRGRGLMIGMEINTTKNAAAAKLFATRGIQLGIYFGFFGTGNSVVRIEPPLVIGKRECGIILDVVSRISHEFSIDAVPDIAFRNTRLYAGGL